MDGIESREGVYIVAASSRPDLIDSAVLRPGRLDKILNCDFPNFEERYEILKNYYDKSINLSKDDDYSEENLKDIKNHSYVSLKQIAEKSDFYTGADLQSLIYNAFLSSAKRNIHNNLDKHPVITDEDITNAFNNFKRSLGDKDIQFYNEIKNKYSSRTDGNNKNNMTSDNHNSYEESKERHDKLLNEYNENSMKQTLY